jgi:hypothetical protein
MLPSQISPLPFSPLTAILWILALVVLTYLIVAFQHGRELRRHDELRWCRMLPLEMWPQVLEELQRRQRDYERMAELRHRIEPVRNWYLGNRLEADTLHSEHEKAPEPNAARNLIKTTNETAKRLTAPISNEETKRRLGIPTSERCPAVNSQIVNYDPPGLKPPSRSSETTSTRRPLRVGLKGPITYTKSGKMMVTGQRKRTRSKRGLL